MLRHRTHIVEGSHPVEFRALRATVCAGERCDSEELVLRIVRDTQKALLNLRWTVRARPIAAGGLEIAETLPSRPGRE